jgi:LysM repeat protein
MAIPVTGRTATTNLRPLPHPFQRPYLPQFSLTWLLVFLSLIISEMVRSIPIGPAPPAEGPVWGSRPLLGYFALTPSLASLLQDGARLSPGEFQLVQTAAREETQALEALEAESLGIIQDHSLTLEDKRQRITEMGYNARLDEIVRASQSRLQASLDRRSYQRLVRWVEARWIVERELHGHAAAPAASGPRSYRIFATRYDSNGAYTVALPDKCLKFSNAGNSICADDGYSSGMGYSVIMSYKGSTGAVVGESGPWNVDDNFWATTGDPQPRRKFADLGLGMPEAQAAYFNGYNGGKDQFGRKVTAPFAIDLARQVSIDIGLEPGNNDWITVSFMWTEGWGTTKGKGSTKSGTSVPAATSQPTIAPVNTSTPNPDGAVIHVVQPGQTLWSIATSYNVSLAELYRLNGLTDKSVILPGQKILVVPPAGTATPTATEPPPTPTSTSTRTSTPTRPPPSPTPSPTLSPTPTIDPFLGSRPAGRGPDALLLTVGVLTLVGGALVVVGKLLNRAQRYKSG